MHQQIRLRTKSESDADGNSLVELLRQIAAEDINLAAVGGGSLEHGGQIVIACHEEAGRDDTAKVIALLERNGIAFEPIDEGENETGYLHVGRMGNREGELAREVAAALHNAGGGHAVQDIAVGVPYDEGGELVFPVQIFLSRGDAAASEGGRH